MMDDDIIAMMRIIRGRLAAMEEDERLVLQKLFQQYKVEKCPQKKAKIKEALFKKAKQKKAKPKVKEKLLTLWEMSRQNGVEFKNPEQVRKEGLRKLAKSIALLNGLDPNAPEIETMIRWRGSLTR